MFVSNVSVSYNDLTFSSHLPDLIPFLFYLLGLSFLTFEMLEESRRRRFAPLTCWEVLKVRRYNKIYGFSLLGSLEISSSDGSVKDFISFGYAQLLF